ncbi:discoidin domain-containing protein [Dictyobacter kobayashii]|nr:discoidin domain-containing protein [Dictyobacter kobayashii]
MRRRNYGADPDMGHVRPTSHRSTGMFCGIAMLFCALLVASLWQIFQPSTIPAKAAGTPPAMGINLIGVGDTNTDFLFADMIKEGFRLQPPPNSSTTPALDANGWPTGDFSAFLWDGGFNPPANKINGTYALRFTGKAHVGARFAFGTVSPQNSDGTTGTYDASTNTTTATVVYTADTMALEFTNTQRTASSATNTGVTNIQLMRPVSPGASTSYSFNTTFTTDIKTLVSKFQAIRFMDYSATNGNTDVNWADRQSPVGPSQGKGAWEYAIQLCNETGRDAYINVPALATDDYVTQLAQLFKYGSDTNGNVYTSPQANPVHAPLNSNLHLYIEYSNEVWNGMFASFNQNYNAAQAEVAAGNSPLNYDGETGTYQWGWRRIGLRIKQISDIFRSVFGDSAMPPNASAHIRPLLEWQYGDAQGTADQPLNFLNNYYNNADGKQHVSNPHPVNYFLWGGGGAAYTGVNNANASTIDDMYNSGFGDGTVNPSTGTVKTDVQWARTYGLHDVAYEGGFQIGGDYANSLQKQANVDPRAQQLEVQTQTEFNQAGGELLMYFDSTSPNYGLAVPTVFDQNTPKMQAINQLNQTSVTPTPTPNPTSTPTPTGGSLPAPWQQQDIGSVGQAGSASASNGTFTVTGSGNDIWDTADAFQYVSQPLSGDGTIVARIDSQQNTDGWAKAGVMIRESLTAGSTHALMALTPGNGAVFQRRTTTGGSSSSTAGASVAAPYWVKLQRAGSTFTGSISSDGSNWTVVGSDTISMGTNAYVGLAVTAHNTSVLNTTSFSQVSVTGAGGGTTSNLSQNKPATASSSENSGVGPGYAVDGDPSTRWSSLYSDPQWLQVDLGASHRIIEVKLQWETAYGKAYQIQVSPDGSNWTTIYTQSNGSGGTEDLKGLSGTGRYVRMYGTQRGTSWGYSLYEFQVFGS